MHVTQYSHLDNLVDTHTFTAIIRTASASTPTPIATDMSSDRRSINQKSSTSKSMNALRQLLQESINEEIDEIMQRYIKQYIEPAAENIEMNQKLGVIATNGIPPKQCIKTICRQILDEAKKMY
uniref:DNTTIP1 dimerisation domain-containing protein n=1 Tax=Aceria tosichella TaxID=561515 RepID=A0A6G1S9M5_9ACAR